MKRKKKKYIRYTKERAVLSDVLPFEVPIIFSNRYFYRFLVNNGIQVKDNLIEFKDAYSRDESEGYRQILMLLFDTQKLQSGRNNVLINTRKIPFSYRIAHKEVDFRELTIVHPANQIALIEFYEKYKEQIIYYSKISPYSIRKPDTVAKFVFFNDKLHKKEKGDHNDFLELRGKEYENLKSFFAYKKYTNIYRFYEDYRYQRAEKKYKILHKFDITKCFDSIYSHSIVWALCNKEIVKFNVELSKGTFGGQFDKLMQHLNAGETNGIVIGPEFSRIFAEIILQQADRAVEEKLRIKERLYNRKDYEIYRYVDDYFLFCNKESEKECVVKYFRHALKEFKMSLNDSKSKSYERPMITEISIAKQKINQLFEKEPVFKIVENEVKAIFLENDIDNDEMEETILAKYTFKFFINSNKLASKFKTVIKESKVEYKDVLNYTLAILNNKIEKIILKFEEQFKKVSLLEYKHELSEFDLDKKNSLEKKFTKFLIGYIDFVFFLYSVSPRVNSSIKLSNILTKIISYYKGCYKIPKTKTRVSRMSHVNQDLVFKKISDDISLILERHQMDKHTQIEVLYLLIILRELGKNYRINQNQLAKYFNCFDKENNKVVISEERFLNYFSIVVLLFYIRDISLYTDFRTELKKYIISYITEIDPSKRKINTETNILMMDLLVCPFLDRQYKEQLLHLYSVPSEIIPNVINFEKYQKFWFIKWENFDLSKELNSKNSEEVYS